MTPVVDTFERLVRDTVALLPGLAAAVAVFVLLVLVARLVRSAVAGSMKAGGRNPNLAEAVARLVQGAIVIGGLLIAATIAFPTFRPGDLITILGIGSVAIGFAFKDILQNFLAGILILWTDAFRTGDQIVYGEYEGTVEDVHTRATTVRTYDGRRAVIPNFDLFTNSVLVNTAYPARRTDYDVGIGYGDDIAAARRIMLAAIREAEGVLEEPAADVIVVDLSASTVNLRARWWTHPTRADTLAVQDRVLERIVVRLSEAGIDLPYDTRVVLFHDQTEDTDGDRARQRAGWPAPGDGSSPQPRRIADAILASGHGPEDRAGQGSA